MTTATVTYSESQQEDNWENLSPEQRAYFNRLAEGDPERTGKEFFEDTVPSSLQDDPEKLEVFLNGGTVTTYEWEPARGRAGGEWVEVEHELPDRDWSHDVSRANGGSDSADNGRWEESSTNRSRGSDNTTAAEREAADTAAARDAELLEEGEVLEQAEKAADLALAAEASELVAVAADVTLDFLAPALGGAAVAKLAADQFEQTEHKIAAGAGAGVATAAVLCTPVGQAGLACYLGYKLCRTGYRFFTKRAARA